MKKVLIFSLAYYPRVGGAEVAIKEITDRIGDIEFEMITLRFDSGQAKQEQVGRVLVHRVSGPKFFYPIAATLKARALQRHKKFDAAWAMMSYMALPALLCGLPYALTLQDGDNEAHVFGRPHIVPFLPLLRSAFKNARAVSALSTFLALWAKKMGYRGRVEIVPNGADSKKFSGEKVPHDGTILITSSRLVHKNAVDDIIRALALLPDIHFVVCGTGPDEHALKSLARELGVAERISWRGHVDNADLPRHLHHADIFIRPSRSEGFGISFVEAMAAGVPVVATQEGGLKDYITSEVAWPVEKDRPDQIALQIKAILSNPEQSRLVVERAQRLVAEKYDWNLIARDMREKVFSRLFV
ncbi:glycosyltransferase family 1 protein [Candidatus Kaiserbacteria bacterium]|nr:glycosyltransferase family 1 protein [Candidatus Kaiserbacteria bacterium]